MHTYFTINIRQYITCSLQLTSMSSLAYVHSLPPLNQSPLLPANHHRPNLKSYRQIPHSLAANGVATPSPLTSVDIKLTAEQRPSLPSKLLPGPMPRHVAIIMDGNSRWARARGSTASAGHEAGYRALKEVVRMSCEWGIRVLTVFAFSNENWLRPKIEVEFLMMLFENVLRQNINEFMEQGIRVCLIGNLSKLPKSLQKLVEEVVDITSNNKQLDLIVAVSYSGRRDITQACQKISEKVKQGLLEPADITESVIAQELETSSFGVPDPDLLIRTSGELRISNFLLWQSAYTEFFFTKTHWPDFGESDYIEALSSFQNRQRRFGLRVA